MTAPNLIIEVNGAALTVDVEYSITITHGRNDITATPQPSDAQITLYGFGSIPTEIGDDLQIFAYGDPRFTGYITDQKLTYLVDGTARLTIQAIGNLARIAYSFVGTAGYAQEDLTDRVDNILTETGYTYTNNSIPLMSQLALDPQDGGYSALDLLLALGTETGGTLADLPDGAILWESYARRGYGYNPATWGEVIDPFSAVAYIWSDVYEATEATPHTVILDKNAVVFAPEWAVTLQTVLNSVTVIYGNSGQHAHTETEPDSITTYGLRAQTINTQLHDHQDAQDRAEDVIRSQAYPRYALQNVTVLVHMLTGTPLTNVLALISGSRVEIENMPNPHPIEDYLGVVEGWSETYTPEMHALTLSLSDPRYSYAVAQWGQVDPLLAWSGVDPVLQWYNVVLPGDLAA